MVLVDKLSDDEAARLAGRPSIAYVMAIAGEVLRTIPIDFLDLLIVTTISNANLLPPARPRTPGPDDPAPDRSGISRNAVSRALNVPLETVRRRAAGLIEKKVLADRDDGLVFVPDNPLGLGNNTALWAFNMTKLRALFAELKALGVELEAK